MTDTTVQEEVRPARTDGGHEPELNRAEIWAWWRLISFGALDGEVGEEEQMALAVANTAPLQCQSHLRAEARRWMTATEPSPLAVWEKLRDAMMVGHGDGYVGAWIQLLPADQRPRARKLAYDIDSAFHAVLADVTNTFQAMSAAAMGTTDEPASAVTARFETAIADHPHKGLLEAMLVNAPIRGSIWQKVRPE